MSPFCITHFFKAIRGNMNFSEIYVECDWFREPDKLLLLEIIQGFAFGAVPVHDFEHFDPKVVEAILHGTKLKVLGDDGLFLMK